MRSQFWGHFFKLKYLREYLKISCSFFTCDSTNDTDSNASKSMTLRKKSNKNNNNNKKEYPIIDLKYFRKTIAHALLFCIITGKASIFFHACKCYD